MVPPNMIWNAVKTLVCLFFLTLPGRGEGAFPEFVDPHPDSSHSGFGTQVVPLSNGNVVITAPGDDFGANNAGAVHLFNGATGELISTVTGSHVNDQIGSGGILALPNGNFVIFSPVWGNGAGTWVGSVTWVNGKSGLSGIVSAANSLVGNLQNDQLGSEGGKVVGDSNYVVMSRNVQWPSGGLGASTWCSGSAGLVGAVSAANSLIGSQTNETAGGYSASGLKVLPNGNYLVFTTNRTGGAVTWAAGNVGVRGVASSANSLTGNGWTSAVPGSGDGVTVLANGNFVVVSAGWDNGTWTDAGAVTWGSSEHGISGEISPANSLVGGQSQTNMSVIGLANGHYLVKSLVGITWCDGMTGRTGELSANDSLTGYAYSAKITTLPNGNFLIVDSSATVGSYFYAGIVTWFDGSHASSGAYNAANSFVGGYNNDNIGSKIVVLANGNYVILGSGRATATWANGATGIRGVVSTANSLFCPAPYVQTHDAFALSNGHYVVVTSGFRMGALDQIGAVTWCDGASGRTGMVGPANSLIGSKSSDEVGNAGVLPLTNGNYVVLSSLWKTDGGVKTGAATWCRGDQETSGIVGSGNSLIGSAANDSDSIAGVALPNGNYLVVRPKWDLGTSQDAGAITWCPGDSLFSGAVSVGNSLIGVAGQNLGATRSFETVPPIRILTDGDYVVRGPWPVLGIPSWRGSLTWGSSTAGVTGVISADNSIIGPTDNANLGDYDVIPLPDGGFLGTIYPGGCVVWGDGKAPATGIAVPGNCLMSPPDTLLGMTPVVDPVNHSYYGAATEEGINGKVKVGSFVSGGRSIPVIKVEVVTAIPVENGRTEVGFGVLAPGQTATKTFRVYNKGNWPLDIGTLALTPAGSSPFSINTGTMTTPLISGRSTTFTVSFAPTVSGMFTKTLSIPNTDLVNHDFQLTLWGGVNRPPLFSGYASSGWGGASVVIPISRLLERATDPEGGSVQLASVGPASSLGGAAVISGTNILYKSPSVSATDSFIVGFRDNLGVMGYGTVTVALALPPVPEGNPSSFVARDDSGHAGVMFITEPGKSWAVEVSGDLKSWRRLAVLPADASGKISFVDDASPDGRGFYRLAPP